MSTWGATYQADAFYAALKIFNDSRQNDRKIRIYPNEADGFVDVDFKNPKMMAALWPLYKRMKDVIFLENLRDS